MSLLRKDPLVCQEVVELITDYLEGTLSRRDRRRFDEHLAGCPHCTEYLAQMGRTLELTGCLVAEDLSPDARREFEDIYRNWRSGS
jgi:anti-sigma factor RsiW